MRPDRGVGGHKAECWPRALTAESRSYQST